MSLELSESHGILVKTGLPCTCHGDGWVNIYRLRGEAPAKFQPFDINISMSDFCAMAEYVLVNTPLDGKDDPRIAFLKHAKTMSFKKPRKQGLPLRKKS